MSKAKSWLIRVRHIVESIQEIEKFIGLIQREEFYEDIKTIRAVERCFLIIGEAAKHVPDDITKLYSHIPWRKMREMRNFVIHQYEDVEHDILWDTIQKDLPPLKTQLEQIVKDHEDE